MFNLHNKSKLFKDMSLNCPELLQDLEIIYENKLLLDQEYHFPKQFILHLNNLVRSLIFFTDSYKKNKPSWVKNTISNFIIENHKEFVIVKKLRNTSSHNKLILPNESLSFGLFKICGTDYKLKLGMGDFGGSGNYSPEFTLKNTEDILLELNHITNAMFMDIEHSALNECLGVTRKWFFNINIKELDLNEAIDIYNVVSSFSIDLINDIIKSYSIEYNIEVDNSSLFKNTISEHNYINTVLELDIYPALFSKWWNHEVKPFNYGVIKRSAYHSNHLRFDYAYLQFYKKILTTPDDYLKMIKKLSSFNIEELFYRDNINDFICFIKAHHWHYTKSFKDPFKIDFSSMVDIAQSGNRLIDAYLNDHIDTELQKYYNKFQESSNKVIKLIESNKTTCK